MNSCVNYSFRLASVQEQRPVNVPHFQAKEPNADDHQALLENIAAIIPDHEARLQGVEVCVNIYLILP